MLPATYPLALYRGDSYSWQFKLWADEDKTIAVDLTGVTAKAELRSAPGTDPVISMVCTVTLPNIIDVTLPASAWDDYVLTKAGAAVWDLQLTYASGDIKTLIRGDVSIVADVTDSIRVVARA